MNDWQLERFATIATRALVARARVGPRGGRLRLARTALAGTAAWRESGLRGKQSERGFRGRCPRRAAHRAAAADRTRAFNAARADGLRRRFRSRHRARRRHDRREGGQAMPEVGTEYGHVHSAKTLSKRSNRRTHHTLYYTSAVVHNKAGAGLSERNSRPTEGFANGDEGQRTLERVQPSTVFSPS